MEQSEIWVRSYLLSESTGVYRSVATISKPVLSLLYVCQNRWWVLKINNSRFQSARLLGCEQWSHQRWKSIENEREPCNVFITETTDRSIKKNIGEHFKFWPKRQRCEEGKWFPLITVLVLRGKRKANRPVVTCKYCFIQMKYVRLGFEWDFVNPGSESKDRHRAPFDLFVTGTSDRTLLIPATHQENIHWNNGVVENKQRGLKSSITSP